MNNAILNTKAQEFINNNLTSDLVKLALKGSPFHNISIQELIIQIEGKLKARDKLSTWYNTKNIYYPPKINLEQTSSEATAAYKSQLVSGKKIADLTGGFGVDSYYFGKRFESVTHFETNKKLSEIAAHNFTQLGQSTVCIDQDGIISIDQNYFDLIYIDPSRRDKIKGKVFYLKDCNPNIIEHFDYLTQRCGSLMIKTSPMLDISAGLEELHDVKEIHIVAVNNEVKELLWLIEKGNTSPTQIVTANLKNDHTEKFQAPLKQTGDICFSLPEKYLYEPNAAIMKSGLFKALSRQFQVKKLEANTHLFTSDEKIPFPGRRFEIQKSIPYTRSEVKKHISGMKANLAVRNFPETVSSLKKRWKIKDGGDKYLFFITNLDKKKVILECVKI